LKLTQVSNNAVVCRHYWSNCYWPLPVSVEYSITR